MGLSGVGAGVDSVTDNIWVFSFVLERKGLEIWPLAHLERGVGQSYLNRGGLDWNWGKLPLWKGKFDFHFFTGANHSRTAPNSRCGINMRKRF